MSRKPLLTATPFQDRDMDAVLSEFVDQLRRSRVGGPREVETQKGASERRLIYIRYGPRMIEGVPWLMNAVETIGVHDTVQKFVEARFSSPDPEILISFKTMAITSDASVQWEAGQYDRPEGVFFGDRLDGMQWFGDKFRGAFMDLFAHVHARYTLAIYSQTYRLSLVNLGEGEVGLTLEMVFGKLHECVDLLKISSLLKEWDRQYAPLIGRMWRPPVITELHWDVKEIVVRMGSSRGRVSGKRKGKKKRPTEPTRTV